MASMTSASTQVPPEETLPPSDMMLPDLFEVIDGVVVELPPMGFKQLALANELKRLIDAYLSERSLGRFFVEGLFDLRPAIHRNRRPDGAFVSFDRWPKTREFPDDNALPAVPDLSVEFVSRTDHAIELLEKVHEYFAAGTQLVWVVYPSVGQVYVYSSTTEVRILGRADSLDGGEVLPGFVLPLAELFGPEAEQGG